MRTVLFALLSSAIMIVPASAHPPILDAVVTVRTVAGFQIAPGSPSTVTTGLQITDVSPTPLTIGTFDHRGRVVGGDAVLVAFIDLGTAPLAQAAVGGMIIVTPSDPRASDPLNATGFVLPPDFTGIEPQLTVGTAALGTEGVMFLGLAFLTHARQPLSEALGVTVAYRVAIGPASMFLTRADGAIFSTTQMTIGGAAFFEVCRPRRDREWFP